SSDLLFEHGAPLRLTPGEELQRHGEMLELLGLRVAHDRLGLGIAFERNALLVPADCFSLFLQGRDHARKCPYLLAQLTWRLVILVGWHSSPPFGHILPPSKESRQLG